MTNDPLSVYTNDKSCHLDPTIYARYYTIKSVIFNFGHIITGKEQDGKHRFISDVGDSNNRILFNLTINLIPKEKTSFIKYHYYK
jgi:hypothetical protein